MFNSYVQGPEGTHHHLLTIRRCTFFHPICLGKLIFTHPMSGTRHHFSDSWENSASINVICGSRLNIHGKFPDFFLMSVFSCRYFFWCFCHEFFRSPWKETPQEGLEFPAHSHHQRPDLVAPRGLLLFPGHQEGTVDPCVVLNVNLGCPGSWENPFINGSLKLGKTCINRGLMWNITIEIGGFGEQSSRNRDLEWEKQMVSFR